MRVTILALGSRGDVQPFVPLGRGLLMAGHQVRIVTFREYAPLVLNAGLDFHPLRGDARQLLHAAMSAGLLNGRVNALSYIRAIKQSYASLTETLGEDLSDPALHDSDLILNQLPAHLYGSDLAEYLKIPWAVVSVIPLARTRHRPMIGFPTFPSFVPGYNALTYRLAEQMGWHIFRQSVNRWRTEILNLPAKPYFGDYETMHKKEIPIINGFSPLVVERMPDWGPHIHITGWWQPEDPNWIPADRLKRFLERGDKPIFIGFGSIPVDDPELVTSIIVDAVRLVGRKAILHAGWAGLGAELPDVILPIHYAPYSWLFPRMASIVHHGGSGTSGFAFTSGVPNLVVPFGFDQYYWGERAADLGVGPRPLPFKNLNAIELAEMIHTSIFDENMKRRAQELAGDIKSEDGVTNAVKIIEAISTNKTN